MVASENEAPTGDELGSDELLAWRMSDVSLADGGASGPGQLRIPAKVLRSKRSQVRLHILVGRAGAPISNEAMFVTALATRRMVPVDVNRTVLMAAAAAAERPDQPPPRAGGEASTLHYRPHVMIRCVNDYSAFPLNRAERLLSQTEQQKKKSCSFVFCLFF